MSEDPLSEEYLIKNAERCVREATPYLEALNDVFVIMLERYKTRNAPADEMVRMIKKVEYLCNRIADKMGYALDYENPRLQVENETEDKEG